MKYYIHTLGCKVNAYESKVMSDLLSNNGYSKGCIDDSDIVIINTCFVTNVAEKKSLQMIRKFKKEGRLVIVTGCLSQAKPELVKEIKEVSIILGNQDKSKILDYIKEYKDEVIVNIYDLDELPFEEMKLNNFDKTRAFVKIQDGCENFCTYCIIPYTRGKLRSKKLVDVISEIKELVKSGHKEIVLTGIHTGNYHDGGKTFADLLKEVVKIKDIVNLRISSIECSEVTNEVIEVIKNNDVIVDHMHIPLQSGSNEILISMNRKYTKEEFIENIERIRSIRPNISITTDVIVGFPGETDELFNETVETIKKINFTKLHVFPYSRREGTKADLFDNQIDEQIKKERVKELLKISMEQELKYMEKFVGCELSFIPETYKEDTLIGHTGNFLSVKVKGNKELLHEVIKVKIENIEYPFCLGNII